MAQGRSRTREIALVLALCALTFGYLRARGKDPSEVSLLDRAVLRLLSPIERGVLGIGRFFASIGHRYVFLVGAEAESDRLRTENMKLRAENTRLTLEAERTPRLEALLGMRARIMAPTVTARLVGLESSSYFHVVRMVLEHDAEVKQGMPVIAAEGIVGRVERVVGPYCDVLLISDARASVDVTLPRTKSRGLMHGMGNGRDYAMKLDFLARDGVAAEGDLVVTSVLSAFPPNLPVGKVRKLAKKEQSEELEAVIDPLVDYSHLEEVLIVLAPVPPAAQLPGGKKL